MLKTFFGCCSLRRGASCIAIFNLLWNVTEILKHIEHRRYKYEKFGQKHNVKEFNNSDDNSTYNDYTSEVEMLPVLNGLFMDYVFITCVGWIVMELIANIGLKQSTYKLAIHKIYAWLVIYYGNIIFMILHLCYYEIENIKRRTIERLTISNNQSFGGIEMKLIYTAIVIIEIVVIHSYYIAEEKAALQNFIQIKWKYVSKGEVMSSGVDYPSTSNFTALTSRQTQEGSRIPPFITRVIQD